MAHWFYVLFLFGIRSVSDVFTLPIDPNATLTATASSDHRCHRMITFDEVQRLLSQSPCAADLRMKRSADSDTSNHIYALQTTVNDHRTIIDDHRTMINYLMNNTVNITQLEQHMRRSPIWTSWRDLSLVLLLIILVLIFIYLLASLFKPLDSLTSFLLRRQQAKKRMQKKKKNNNNNNNDGMAPRQPSDLELDTMSATLERNFMRY